MSQKTSIQRKPAMPQKLRSLLVSDKVPTKLSRHCIATVIVKDPAVLVNSTAFVNATQKILSGESVQCIGEVTYDFYNDSFTTVFALAESHISVHTWPERHAVQLDVFLCNYMNDNTDKCQRIFESIIEYFNPSEVERTFVDRL